MSTFDPGGKPPARRYYVQRVTICPPDLNADLMLTSEDVQIALNGGAGDFNQDGVEDSRDYIAYMNAYAARCE